MLLVTAELRRMMQVRSCRRWWPCAQGINASSVFPRWS